MRKIRVWTETRKAHPIEKMYTAKENNKGQRRDAGDGMNRNGSTGSVEKFYTKL